LGRLNLQWSLRLSPKTFGSNKTKCGQLPYYEPCLLSLVKKKGKKGGCPLEVFEYVMDGTLGGGFFL
jgi:hypothetical protein